MGSILAPFLIMLREGLEAALIISIVAAYLGQTGRRGWMPVMGVGIGLAVALALGAGAALQWLAADFPQKQQELFEAVVGFLAVGMLTYMVLWMNRSAKSMSARLRGAVDAATAQHKGSGGAWALVGMVFLAVAREGLESVFFLLAVFQQSPGWQAPAAALAGVAVAAVVGVLIYKGGLRLDLRRFFGWTAVLILFVAAGLLMGSVRKLHEAGVWNIGQQVLADWSDVLPMDSVAGSVLSGLLGYQATPVLSEALAYFAYLLVFGGWLLLRSRGASPVVKPAPAPSASAPSAVAAAAVTPDGQTDVYEPSAPFWNAMLGVATLLALGGLYAFYAASARPRAEPASDVNTVTVTIRGMACDPADITVPAGRTRFVIVNESNRALEWEILDGVMVIDERENITPGMNQTLNVRLQPGEFEITCGLLSSPRGKLHVLPSAASEQRARSPQMVDFVGVMAEYRVYSLLQWGEVADAVDQLSAALQAGDVAKASGLLAQGYEAYQTMAPVTLSFADLESRLDARPDYLAEREKDAAFTGFRAISTQLAPQLSAQPAGQAVAGDLARAQASVNQLSSDWAALKERVRGLDVTPELLLRSTIAALRRQASHMQGGDAAIGNNAASHELDAAAERGLLSGVTKVVDSFETVLAVSQPADLKSVRAALQAWQDSVNASAGVGNASNTSVRQQSVNALADALAQLQQDSGLDQTQPVPAQTK